MKYIIFLWLTVNVCFLAAAQTDYLKEGIRQYEITNYPKAVKLLDLEITGTPSAEAYYYRAKAKAHMRNFREALEDFTLSLSWNPHKPETYMFRGGAHYELENYKEAITDFSKALEYRSNYYEALLYRAESETKLELYKEALQDYEAAIIINPHVSNNYFERGQLFLSLKRYKDANTDFDQYIVKFPMDPDGYVYRARAKRGLQNEQGALADEKKAKELKSNAVSYTNEGVAQYNIKNYKAAIEKLDQAIFQNTKDGRAYFFRAWSKFYLKNYPDALLDFNKAIELNKDAESYYGRALLKHTLRDYNAALVDYDKCLQLSPSFIACLVNRGRCKMHSGDNDGAKTDFENVIKLDETDANGYYNLALLEKSKGEVDKACYYFKQAAEHRHATAEDDIELYCK